MTWLDKKLTASAGGPITVILSNGESSAILPGQPVTTIDGLARLATAGYGGSAFATVTGLVVEGGGPTLSWSPGWNVSQHIEVSLAKPGA